MSRIVEEEDRCLARVLERLTRANNRPAGKSAGDYENEMLQMRDEIAGARLEDVPPLLEQMERLQALAKHKRDLAAGRVDRNSPYFGHMVLDEAGRKRDVLIGRTTYLDTNSGVRIVDWRDAPVSRLYYRYDEGDGYDEVFGDREVSGEVLTRRSVTISDGSLKRISAPQGAFARNRQGEWRRLAASAAHLAGGAGTAIRPENHHRPGRLGVGSDSDSDDKLLQEITPLIDPRQFELLTRPDSGLVVIQGGAGSGKTTIGLHRMAYLAFNDARRFRPDRMMVIVFNTALARYIGQVLPALGVEGVAIRTYQDWAARVRQQHLHELPHSYSDETPGNVTRFKKHPVMLHAIRALALRMAKQFHDTAQSLLGLANVGEATQAFAARWAASLGKPLGHRLHDVERWLRDSQGFTLPSNQRLAFERALRSSQAATRDLPAAWAELLGNYGELSAIFGTHAPDAFTEKELHDVHAFCNARCAEILSQLDEHREEREERASREEREEAPDSDDGITDRGIDGRKIEEKATLDREDDTLFLKLAQELLGPLRRGVRLTEALVYEHILIDEAQDLSPVELDVVLGTVSKAMSVTLAGDVAQRLLMDNGFSDWETVLSALGMAHVAIEPLKLSYRSTQEILDFAHAVLGPLGPSERGKATRHGAPVELFSFSHSGDSMGFLVEALRQLTISEPRASVAVIARFPEHADIYYDGLERGEVSGVRRVAHQDFTFKPGVDVTDVRQVKGLEFDYVVLVEVSEGAYPDDPESRHLLHIAATRAAHQLWVLTTGRPSPLLPEKLLEAAT